MISGLRRPSSRRASARRSRPPKESRRRAASAVAFAFAVVSLLAAAGGLFSVLSYAVGGRRREFGIRVAMGAQASAVVPLAWLLSRAIMMLAFGVTITNPLIWGMAITVVGAATLFAAWPPSVTAVRANPLMLRRDDSRTGVPIAYFCGRRIAAEVRAETT